MPIIFMQTGVLFIDTLGICILLYLPIVFTYGTFYGLFWLWLVGVCVFVLLVSVQALSGAKNFTAKLALVDFVCTFGLKKIVEKFQMMVMCQK